MKEGWKLIAFPLCIEKINTTTKLQSSCYGESGAYPIVSQEKELISGYWDKHEDLFCHKTPVTIFGDHTMVVKYVDFDFVIGADGVKILQPKPFLNPKYFYYWVSSTKIVSHGYARHFRYLKEKEVPYPSLSEQQRIVGMLDAEFEKIDALKANAEKNLQNAKDLFLSALKKELEPKQGWAIKTIGDVCEVQGGSTPLRSEPLFWQGGTYPWFTVDDIREQGRYIIDTKQKITKLAWDKLRVFPANTVLLCCTASVGEYAITKIPITSNQQFNGLTIKKDVELLPEFLFHFASTLKETLLSLSGKATIDFVSGAKVKNIDISFPPSVMKQKEIVLLLDELESKCQNLQDNYTQTIALCDDLKQALLRKAFSGEL